MAGLSPFQFSSRKLQDKATGSAWGISMGGSLGNVLKSALSWYDMWINPEKLTISTQYKQKRQHTAGSIVTYHYRREVYMMSVSGFCGWVMIQSKSQGTRLSVRGPEGKEILTTPYAQLDNGIPVVRHNYLTGKWQMNTKTPGAPSNPRDIGLASDNTDNSPRMFLNRLKSIADEPAYYVDVSGVEHYNTKFIKIFTKQFPQGIICEGYYTKFDIPEAAEDAQTIAYSFEFVIENLTPISVFEKELGMWGLGKQVAGVFKSF
jgi:hypothetical protein